MIASLVRSLGSAVVRAARRVAAGDERCAEVLGSYRAISRDVRRAVAKECERFVRDHIEHGLSFAVETTRRTTASIEQAERARQRGFKTYLRFVAIDSIAENVARVLQRAQGGGHGASERDVRTSHEASIGPDANVVRLIRDRDGIYGSALDARARNLGIEQLRTSPRCPWQNGYAESWVGTLRRELLDQVIVLGERHLLRLVRRHASYYNEDRLHMSLDGHAPVTREIEPMELGKVIALPRVSGLHHRYVRRAA